MHTLPRVPLEGCDCFLASVDLVLRSGLTGQVCVWIAQNAGTTDIYIVVFSLVNYFYHSGILSGTLPMEFRCSK